MKQLWVFDFDGTLSDLVPNRAVAAILPDSQLMLEELSSRPNTAVAILTSRTLEDLRHRVDNPSLFLGGTSGLFWQSPQQTVTVANPLAKERAVRLRDRALPKLREMLQPFEIDLEDKFVSVTIHFRGLEADMHPRLLSTLKVFASAHNLDLFPGPFAHEIPLDSMINKAEGLRALFDLHPDAFDVKMTTFAGDDTNDAEAMSWLIENGGQAIVVDNRIEVPGAYRVANPLGLVHLILLKLAPTSC